MKPRQIIIINLIFCGLALFSVATVYEYLTGQKPLAVLSDFAPRKAAIKVTTSKCSDLAPLDLVGVQAPELEKLAVYQQACSNSFVTDTVMTFEGMPTSTAEANATAAQMAAKLKDFAAHGVRPLVMVEPTDYATNVQLDFAQVAAGAYTPYLGQYFAALKATGVTDAQMGIWNPFPEANLPYWSNNQPQYFAPDVNLFVATMRTYFPTAQASIMLNSATYQTTDFNWQNGDYESLLPFVKGITPHSIQYAGLEGFPWLPPAGGNGPILNAAEFLNPSIISETADYLGTKNIWFNTGTFSEKYALDPSQVAYMTPSVRKEVLVTVDTQAQILQRQGYSVSVNLFAQDKSKASEETDWSYWPGNDPQGSLSTVVFEDFVQQLDQQKIGLWLFDE
jgi:hypothetical protein